MLPQNKITTVYTTYNMEELKKTIADIEKLKEELATLDYSEDAIAKRISDAIKNASDKSRIRVQGVTPKTLTTETRKLLKNIGYTPLFYGDFDSEGDDSVGCVELFKL